MRALVLTAAVGVAGAGAPHPHAPAVTYFEGGAVKTVSPSGTPRQIVARVPHGYEVEEASWSPNGGRLAFVRVPTQGCIRCPRILGSGSRSSPAVRSGGWLRRPERSS